MITVNFYITITKWNVFLKSFMFLYGSINSRNETPLKELWFVATECSNRI